MAYYPCRTWLHQVLTRTLSYQRLCWTWPHPALKRTFCYQRTLEVQLSLGLTTLGDPIQGIPWLWNQPFWVGTHHGLSLVRKTRCPLLWLRSNRTRTNALGSTCYYGSNHSKVYYHPYLSSCLLQVGSILWLLCHSFAIVLITASAVVPILRLTLHHSY